MTILLPKKTFRTSTNSTKKSFLKRKWTGRNISTNFASRRWAHKQLNGESELSWSSTLSSQYLRNTSRNSSTKSWRCTTKIKNQLWESLKFRESRISQSKAKWKKMESISAITNLKSWAIFAFTTIQPSKKLNWNILKFLSILPKSPKVKTFSKPFRPETSDIFTKTSKTAISSSPAPLFL